MGLFLCLPLEAGCQHTIYNTDLEVLKYTWFTIPSLKGFAGSQQFPQVSLYYLACANVTFMAKFYKKSHHLHCLDRILKEALAKINYQEHSSALSNLRVT